MEEFTVSVLLVLLFSANCQISEVTPQNLHGIPQATVQTMAKLVEKEKNHEERIKNLEDHYLSLVSELLAVNDKLAKDREVMKTDMQETFDIQLKKIEDKYTSDVNVRCQEFEQKLQEMEKLVKTLGENRKLNIH